MRPIDRMTDRQKDVLALVSRGMKNREIAEALKISTNTVAKHVFNLCNLTGMGSKTELAIWGLSHKEPTCTDSST